MKTLVPTVQTSSLSEVTFCAFWCPVLRRLARSCYSALEAKSIALWTATAPLKAIQPANIPFVNRPNSKASSEDSCTERAGSNTWAHALVHSVSPGLSHHYHALVTIAVYSWIRSCPGSAGLSTDSRSLGHRLQGHVHAGRCTGLPTPMHTQR